MPIINIPRNAWHYIRWTWAYASKIWHVSHLTTVIEPMCLFVCSKFAVHVSTITIQNWCDHRHQDVEPSTVLKIKLVQPSSWPYFSFTIITSYKNQIPPTNHENNESLKSRCIPGGICGLYEWYKAKIYCCAFFAVAMMTMVAAGCVRRALPAQWAIPRQMSQLIENLTARMSELMEAYWCHAVQISAQTISSGGLTTASGVFRKTYTCYSRLIIVPKDLSTTQEHLLTAPKHFSNCSGAF